MRLTWQQVVQQSALIHPDWTPEMHLSYLHNDHLESDFSFVTLAQVQAVLP